MGNFSVSPVTKISTSERATIRPRPTGRRGPLLSFYLHLDEPLNALSPIYSSRGKLNALLLVHSELLPRCGSRVVRSWLPVAAHHDESGCIGTIAATPRSAAPATFEFADLVGASDPASDR